MGVRASITVTVLVVTQHILIVTQSENAFEEVSRQHITLKVSNYGGTMSDILRETRQLIFKVGV